MEDNHEEGESPTADLPAGRRALSFDEFKALYRQQKQAEKAQFRQTGHADAWLLAMRQRRDQLIGDGQDEYNPGETFPRTTRAPGTTQAPPPPPFAPAARPLHDPHQRAPRANPRIRRFLNACAALAVMAANLFWRHGLLFLQICVATMIAFGSWSFKNLLFTCVIFAILNCLKWVATGLQVERHGRGADNGPTRLGRLFRPRGAVGEPTGNARPPISTKRKVGYMIAKCTEAFIVSLWPNYSVEDLEIQLQRDGIVREQPDAAAPPAVPEPIRDAGAAPPTEAEPQALHTNHAPEGAPHSPPVAPLEEIE